MKLAIVGSRGIKSCNLAEILKEHQLQPATIITGGAKGIDTLAESYAKENNIPLEVFLPDYRAHLQGAPIRRNELIARTCDVLLAVWDGKSRGTNHVVNYARKQGKRVIVVSA